MPAALDLANASFELGYSALHYLGVCVTDCDAVDPQRSVYEKLVPDLATRIAKVQPTKVAASRREPTEN